MAKHSLLLGTAAGSIGDVTFYRREGVQVQRARVREIANPQSFGQAEQRNFMAPIAKFYGPLASTLERSWEGLNKSKSYSALLKKNVQIAREEGLYLPKGTPFFPMPYQVSYGTLPTLPVEFDGKTIILDGILPNDDATAWSALSIGLQSLGYKDGDQLTIILVVQDNMGNYFPVTARGYLNSSSTEEVNEVLDGISFDPDGRTAVFGSVIYTAVAGTLIMSRWENNLWRRSTQRMVCSDDIMGQITGELAQADAIASYQTKGQASPSAIYLNGPGVTETAEPLSTVFNLEFGGAVIVKRVINSGAWGLAEDIEGKLHLMKCNLTGATGNNSYLTDQGFEVQDPGTPLTNAFPPVLYGNGTTIISVQKNLVRAAGYAESVVDGGLS